VCPVVPSPSPIFLPQSLLLSVVATLAALPVLAAPVAAVPASAIGLLGSGESGVVLARLVGLMGAPLATLESAVEGVLRSATGPKGLLAVFTYSFLCAVLLPLPGELVLAVPLDLGWSPAGELLAVIAVASTAKAVGALGALSVARGATTSEPVARLLELLPGSSAADGGLSGRLADVAERYGYVGLAGALSIPFAPDTAVIYAFSVVDVRRTWFAAAAFVGTTLRLSIVAGLASALLALL